MFTMKKHRQKVCAFLFALMLLLLVIAKMNVFDSRPNDMFAALTQKQRRIVEEELLDYNFPLNTKLDNFTTALGGKPLKNVIIGSWSTGSTFLGEVIASVPGVFHYFEPLIQLGEYEAGKSTVTQVKNMLECDFTGLDDYIAFSKAHFSLFALNRRLWNECLAYPKYCFDPEFLSAVCKGFPFISMKMVRWRLNTAEELLKDEKYKNELNVRVLKLIRDPRAVVASRRHASRVWCSLETDCADMNKLCSGMVEDYATATKLQRLYPERFDVVRFEELAMEPYQYSEKILNFFRLDYHRKVVEFLNSHTKAKTFDEISVFRMTSAVPFRWMKELSIADIRSIENVCGEAIRVWGYLTIPEKQNLSNFYPLTSYRIV